MKLGLVARADSRGLASQTWDFARYMKPQRVLGIDMGVLSGGYRNRWDHFDGSELIITRYEPDHARLEQDKMGAFLEGLDLIYTVETFYDPRLLEMARARGIATVLHFNYEFYRWARDPDWPRPDELWAPSTWGLENLPAQDYRLMPVPVARDRLPFTLRTSAKTFLHPAGHRAMGDRNGTKLVLSAAQHLQSDAEIMIRTQSAPGSMPPRTGRVRIEHRDMDNYWDQYEGADALVLPRRYGGLSLPMQEAASLGMPIIASDVEPQTRFLHRGGLVPAVPRETLPMPVGDVQLWRCDPLALAVTIDQLARDPELVQEMSRHSDAWAERIAWHNAVPVYRRALESVLSGDAEVAV